MTYGQNGLVTIEYNIFHGFTLITTNLYVGTAKLPQYNGKYTTTPGQFPYDQTKPEYKGSGVYQVQITDNPLPPIYIVAYGYVSH